MTKHTSRAWSAEDEQPLPEPTFFRKIFEDLWDGLFAAIVWGFLLLMLGLVAFLAGMASPVFGLLVAALTMGPALAGLCAACAKSARGGFVRLGEAVRGTFHLYWRSVVLALPVAFLVWILLLTRDIVEQVPGRQELVLSLAFQAGLLLTLLVLHVYLYPVLALYDTPLKRTVLIAGVVAAKFVWQTLALLAVGVALLLATQISALVWLFIPGPWCVIATNATYRLARRIVPEPGPGAIDK